RRGEYLGHRRGRAGVARRDTWREPSGWVCNRTSPRPAQPAVRSGYRGRGETCDCSARMILELQPERLIDTPLVRGREACEAILSIWSFLNLFQQVGCRADPRRDPLRAPQ